MLVLVMGSLFGVNDAEIKVKTETTNKRVEISSMEIDNVYTLLNTCCTYITGSKICLKLSRNPYRM